MKISYNEFHISRAIRQKCNFDQVLFSSSGNVVFKNLSAVRQFQVKLNQVFEERGEENKKVSAGSLNAMGLIDEIFHYVCMLFRRDKAPDCFRLLCEDLDASFTKETMDQLYLKFMEDFPPVAVYNEELSAEEYLNQDCIDEGTGYLRPNREQVLEEMIMLHLANENPAFHPFEILFDDKNLAENPVYTKVWNQTKAFFKTQPVFGPKNNDLITMLKEPVNAAPTSLKGQLDYIRTFWKDLLGEWLRRLLEGIDTISEEEKAAWHPTNGGSPEMNPPDYDSLLKEYERFSPDKDWMPKVVLMAKTVLVWLYQLSKQYQRDITRLDQIPDEELNKLHDEGFTGLWLIGLWQRSNASKRIKQINGNPEAASSAYSLLDYEIADNLGGWSALDNLRRRCWVRGIRLAADMVPNHTGMDGKWVIERPDLFVTRKDCPFPQYTFNGENLSHDSRVSIYLEDHYYSKSDCSVVFKRVDNYTGDVTYIYHGNDGTGMPWNDTAQIDFLNPQAREAVIQQILNVARNFPIIRFDAAMVLAKKHIRRLWYPEPGHGGDIATRSQYAMSNEQFEAAIPNEFWREVVDRCANEVPDTLLLAEAFWMMEGYFTRTLGMHRVYNSAFMNMLKKEENQKYRDTVKNTIKFDPQILKRFVNFMNNPDEETAVAQFGRGDKYFGVCTLMITMPGLPMFGHGQLEGFEEKYGMEYTRAYRDEQIDQGLYDRHCHDIFPLLHKRYLFAGVENFLFYDVWNNGSVNENIFAYSNGTESERTLVFYNNKYEEACGWIKQSCEYAVKTGSGENDVRMESKSLGQGLNLSYGYNHFCIFQEQKSGLWYIRRSDEIINNGMFVMLRGFEYQVYLNVQQVEDTADGMYSKLCDLLNGKGVEDIQVAWEEYCYKDLYKALNDFLNPDFVKGLAASFDGEKDSLSLEDLLSGVKEKALAYYDKEEIFLEEFLSAENKKSDSGKKTASKTAAKTNTKSGKQSAERFKDFSQKLSAYFDQRTVSPKTEPGKKDVTPAAPDCLDLAGGFIYYKNSFLALALYSAVNKLPAECLCKWGYTRKLSDILVQNNLSVFNPRKVFERIFAFKALADEKKITELALAELLVNSKDAWTFAGVNEYNGIKWFNKELIDESLWYAGSVLLSSNLKDKEKTEKIFKSLEAAKDKAEYQCEKFMAAFVKKTKAAAGGKKSSAPAAKKKASSVKEKASSSPSAKVKSKK